MGQELNPVDIFGVIVQPLKVMQDERGAVMHMLRSDSLVFKHFGEIYFSEVNPGVTKAWKRHKRMTQHFSVPTGKVKFVVYDDRSDSPSCGLFGIYELGRPDAYQLLVIPPMLWYGFQGRSTSPSVIANCADMPHDPIESEQISPSLSNIHFEW